jgi:hypothetical protein
MTTPPKNVALILSKSIPCPFKRSSISHVNVACDDDSTPTPNPDLQRFLILPQLSVRLLGFPILKHWFRQEYQGRGLNRERRRHRNRLKRRTGQYLVLGLDRTQWKGRNLFSGHRHLGQPCLACLLGALAQRGQQ